MPIDKIPPLLQNAVLAVENRAYAFPWSQQNFSDALASGYQAQLLMATTEPERGRRKV